MIQFGILGPLEVFDAGQRLPLGGPQQRAVLARLLLDPGRVVSAERLIDDVWDGRPPASAAKTLQKYVSELRKVLPSGVLRFQSGGYVLDIDDDSLDVRRAERLVGSGEFAAALVLWRGDLLADLPEAAFAAAERVRVHELQLYAIESRIEQDLAAGLHGPAVADLAELVEEHPLRERLTALLMLALYRAGRQVEALAVFERHRRRLAEEVGVDPADSLGDLQEAILRHDPWLDLPQAASVASSDAISRSNLPHALTSFIGRAEELSSVAALVAGNRLVTLTGPGGVGKTRLAVELGARVGDRFPGGVWMVDLAGVERAGHVADAVATALDVDTRHAPDELTALVAALAHRPPCLAVLDNCEHLVEPVAAVVVAILNAAHDVRVLATSRRPLGIDGEYVRPLHPLGSAAAAQLFADRAELAGADVSVDAAEEIANRLDGLPLAVELAASQLRVLGPAEVMARLGDQLRFHGRAASVPRRQRTLGEMVQWSYDLLPAVAQQTLSRLGVFAGSLTLSAAEAVCTSSETDRRDVLEHITTLIDHSLLTRERKSSPESRYRLLDTLRLFAVERLAESGVMESARRAHAEYFRVLATEAGPHLYGPSELRWRSHVEADEANLQAALTWTADHDPILALSLAVALWPYWESRWKERQGVAYLEPLLDRPLDVPADLRAWALTAIAGMASNAGEARHAVGQATEAVATFRRLGEDRGLAEALAALGSALSNQGRLAAADQALTEALEVFSRLALGDRAAVVLHTKVFVAMRRGDYERAAEISGEEIAAMRAIGSRRGEATALRHLAVALQHLGGYDEASALCAQALDIWHHIEDPAAVAHVHTTRADIARTRGDLTEATDLYDSALVNLRAIGDRRCIASTYKNMAEIATRRGEHGRARALLQRALAIRHELGDEGGLCEILEGLAGLGDAAIIDEEAAVLLGAAAALRDSTGSRPSTAELEALTRTIARRRHGLGTEHFDDGYEHGAGLSVQEMVDFVLGAAVA